MVWLNLCGSADWSQQTCHAAYAQTQRFFLVRNVYLGLQEHAGRSLTPPPESGKVSLGLRDSPACSRTSPAHAASGQPPGHCRAKLLSMPSVVRRQITDTCFRTSNGVEGTALSKQLSYTNLPVQYLINHMIFSSPKTPVGAIKSSQLVADTLPRISNDLVRDALCGWRDYTKSAPAAHLINTRHFYERNSSQRLHSMIEVRRHSLRGLIWCG